VTAARILNEHRCLLGEGPTYDVAAGALYWFDILDRQLLEQDLDTGRFVRHDLPVMASALFAVDPQRQLLFADDGFYLRDRASGALKLHTALEQDRPGNRCNDARSHPSGSLWAGTMGRKAEPNAGAIYWFRAGAVRRLYDGVTIPNSISFSPDGTIGYFTDTVVGILYRVDLDPATGLPTGDPKIYVDHRGHPGGLDGSVVDLDGVLWNARWGAGCVDAYSSDGVRLESIALPAAQTSCPAFAGKDLTQMVVTSATEGMDDAAMTGDPHAGKTFVLDRPMRGQADAAVAI